MIIELWLNYYKTLPYHMLHVYLSLTTSYRIFKEHLNDQLFAIYNFSNIVLNIKLT